MLKTSEIAKKVQECRESFKLGTPLVEEVHDSGNREIMGISEEDFVLFAAMSVPYQGEPPSDYRVLNAIISDMMASSYKDMETLLAKPVLTYLTLEYRDADYTELLNGLEDYIWEEQLDYTPMVDPDAKTVHFSIELTFQMESLGDSEDSL